MQIQLKIKDYRDSFNEPHKKNPYFLYVDHGEYNFSFSNKKKANLFLTKFKKQCTSTYRELGSHLTYVQKYNLDLVHLVGHCSFMKINENLSFTLERYSKVINNVLISSLYIRNEVYNLYQIIYSNYLHFKSIVTSNNRNLILIDKINQDIDNLKRLKTSFDLLFQHKSFSHN